MYLQACITCVGSGICNMWLAILASPLFLQAIMVNVIDQHYRLVPLMIFSVSATVVTFIHFLACVFTQRVMYPPTIITLVAEKLRALSLTDLMKEGTLSGFYKSIGVSCKMKAPGNFVVNFASAVSMASSVYVCVCVGRMVMKK